MLILASTSATRKALLAQAGLCFDAIPTEIDERAIETGMIDGGGDGRAIALHLAKAKARNVSQRYPGAFVIGTDQTLALGDGLLHKPVDREAARGQLDRLRGKTHRLHAAVALVRDGTPLWSDIQSAELTMRDFTPQERDDVLDREGTAILGSVGAYRLEGPSIRLFQSVTGDYFTILGLPLLPLLGALRLHAPETLL